MIVYLLLGTNIEPRQTFLTNALKFIETEIGTVLTTSKIYETAAWGNENQGNFLNQAVEVETTIVPLALLKMVKTIEVKTGRKQREHWGEREIDIDILLIRDTTFKHELLEVPHPQLHKRRFALIPLNEIAAQQIHPVFNKTIETLLAECEDDKMVV